MIKQGQSSACSELPKLRQAVSRLVRKHLSSKGISKIFLLSSTIVAQTRKAGYQGRGARLHEIIVSAANQRRSKGQLLTSLQQVEKKEHLLIQSIFVNPRVRPRKIQPKATRSAESGLLL
jgi:hypothetical protein